MKRLILLLLLVAAVLVAPAAAHNTQWYWSERKAELRLRQSTLTWSSDVGTGIDRDKVIGARCKGKGVWLGNPDPGGPRLFRHLRCRVTLRAEDPYWIVFHVRGQNTWTYTWLRWDY